MNNVYRNTRHRLKQAGIESSDLEARIFLKAALGVTDADLITGTDKTPTAAQEKQITDWITRRLAGEPVSRILGEREFRGLPFTVTPAVLDPRPDSETIIDAALKIFADRPPPRAILDLGTGSGCLLIALLHEFPQARGVGVDLSPEALEVAAGNAKRNGVTERLRFVQGDWDAVAERKFDLIVSNPPYIPTAEIANLSDEVKNHDPILALDGGKDGLDRYRAIFERIKNLLNDGGAGLFECGHSQMQDVARLAVNAGLCVIESHRDLAGIERVLEISIGEK